MSKITNDLNVELPIAVWLASNTYSGKRDGKSISATGLLKSTRQQVLGLLASEGKGEEVPVDISSLLKSAMGTSFHKSIQDTWENPDLLDKALIALGITPEQRAKIKVNPTNPNEDDFNVFFEQRRDKQFNGWNITGQFDLVIGDSLHDFKSTSTYTYINKTKEQDYIKQGSIYRWLFQDLVKDDILTIHYIFTDWNKNYAKSDSNYPACPFVSVKLPLMSLEETEAYMAKVLGNIDKYHSDIEHLPLCDDHALMISEKVWQYFGSTSATRAGKNFNSLAEANMYLHSKGGKGFIKEKVQEPKGCSYCAYKNMCTQYKHFVETGLIK